MKPLRGMIFVAALGFIACSDSPTNPSVSSVAPRLSALRVESGPESALVSITANMPVFWRVRYGETPAYGRDLPEVGPATELREFLTGLRPLTIYYYQVEARQGTLVVPVTGELQTPDYEPCDERNTTAKKVDVIVTYAPPNPDPYVVMEGVELLDCAGNLLTTVGDKMVLQGSSYVRTWQIRVSYPTGSRPHSFRAMRISYVGGPHFDGWADGIGLRINGVTPIAHSDSLPVPFGGCVPEAGCLPGVRWYFSVDSLGVVRP